MLTDYIKTLNLLFEKAEDLGPIDTKSRWRECFLEIKKVEHRDNYGKTIVEGIPFFLACWKMVRESQDNKSVIDKYIETLSNWQNKLKPCSGFFEYALNSEDEDTLSLKPAIKLDSYIHAATAVLKLQASQIPDFIKNTIKSICLLADIPSIQIPKTEIERIEPLGGSDLIMERAFEIIQKASQQLTSGKVQSAIDQIRLVQMWLLNYDIPTLRTRSITLPFYKHSTDMGGISLLTLFLHKQGNGSLFLHPILNSFCVYDDKFRECIENSIEYVSSQDELKKEWKDRCISWRITDRRQESLPVFPLAGSSWGAGFSLALKSLLIDGNNIDPDCCITGAVDKNGNIKAVEYIIEKIDAAKQSGKIHTVIIPTDVFEAKTSLGETIRSRIDDGYYSPMKVEHAAKIDEAADIATGLNSLLLNYFESMEKVLGKLPSYYPDNYKFDRVRINVKVSEERLREENWEAVQKEVDRRMGIFTDEDMGRRSQEPPSTPLSPYSHARGEETLKQAMEEDKEKKKKIVIFEWDEKAGEKPENKRLIILGDPGFGKTFLLKFEGLRILRVAREDIIKGKGLSSIVFPIFIRLTDIASYFHQDVGGIQFKDNICNISNVKGTRPVVEAIVDSISKQFDGMKVKDLEGFKDFIRGKMETDKCVLLLDALDEVPSNLRDKLRGEISAFSSSHKYTNPRIILSSRIVGYHSPPPVHNAKEVELIAFDNTQIEKFVNAWFGVNWTEKAEEKDKETFDDHQEQFDVIRKSAREIMRDFRRQPAAMALSRIPLLLSFICKLKHSGTLRSISNRATLYHKVLMGLLRDWKKEKDDAGQAEPPDPSVIEDKMILLERMAWEMLQDERKQQYTKRELKMYIRQAKDELMYELSDLGEERSSVILKDLENDGIFIQSGSADSSPYLWLHRTIHEYFIASFIAYHEKLPVKVS